MELSRQFPIPQEIAAFATNVSLFLNSLSGNLPRCSDVVAQQTSLISQQDSGYFIQTSDLFRKRPDLVAEGLDRAARAGDVETAANLIVLHGQENGRWTVTLLNRANDPSASVLNRGQALAFYGQNIFCSK